MTSRGRHGSARAQTPLIVLKLCYEVLSAFLPARFFDGRSNNLTAEAEAVEWTQQEE
jgi:hypothetical protein